MALPNHVIILIKGIMIAKLSCQSQWDLLNFCIIRILSLNTRNILKVYLKPFLLVTWLFFEANRNNVKGVGPLVIPA
ncbi:hypothetical protein Xen7305DRAFT_00005010 [Xenococcus sp. PCC 7305]|nr:hypothetical protein Xen7305DRAFT_00005010 [Xenococcus sp. PCC 7305]